jgi:uncharacterized protein YbaA (DUF1428 family)
MNTRTVLHVDEMDTIKIQSLADAVVVAEWAHTSIVEAWGTDAPTRELAIAAVLSEAMAYWAVELAPGEGIEGYHEVSDALASYLAEQARSIVFALVPRAVRDRARAQVIADMRGPGDDDGR